MSKDELDGLAAEVGVGDPGKVEAEAGKPEALPASEFPTPDPVLAQSCNMLVGIVGQILCARFRVSHLTPEEVAAVGGAAAQVAACYDLTLLDPKTAAWIGLGIATAGVVQPRWQTLQAMQEAARAVSEGSPGPTNGAGEGETAPDVGEDAGAPHDREGPPYPGKKPKRGRKT